MLAPTTSGAAPATWPARRSGYCACPTPDREQVAQRRTPRCERRSVRLAHLFGQGRDGTAQREAGREKPPPLDVADAQVDILQAAQLDGLGAEFGEIAALQARRRRESLQRRRDRLDLPVEHGGERAGEHLSLRLDALGFGARELEQQKPVEHERRNKKPKDKDAEMPGEAAGTSHVRRSCHRCRGEHLDRASHGAILATCHRSPPDARRGLRQDGLCCDLNGFQGLEGWRRSISALGRFRELSRRPCVLSGFGR